MGLKDIKRTFKRKATKAHRKVFGKPKEVMITTGKGGLTKAEIANVLSTLGKAIKKGDIPAFRYEYHPPSIIDKREPIWLIPKTASVPTTRVKVRAVMKAKYGSKYIVS